MNQSTKRRCSNDDDTVQPRRKQAKDSSHADFEVIVLTDDDDDHIDDHIDDRIDDHIDDHISGNDDDHIGNNDSEVDAGKSRMSLVVILRVKYLPEATSVAQGHYPAPSIDHDPDDIPTSRSTTPATSSTIHNDAPSAAHAVDASESTEEEPAKALNEAQLVPLMAELRMNNPDTAERWLGLQKEMQNLIQADADREILRLTSAGRILAQDNDKLRCKLKLLKESKKQHLLRIGELEQQVHTMEDEFRAMQETFGGYMAQANHEKMQHEQTIHGLRGKLKEYYRIREAMAAIG